MRRKITPWQSKFLKVHQLGEPYLEVAEKWFKPLAASLVAYQRDRSSAVLVAMNGSQGSGKSTLSNYLVAALKNEYQLNAVALSLDDFYYTHAKRKKLSETIHPLFATRGVPGTHDISLLNKRWIPCLKRAWPQALGFPCLIKLKMIAGPNPNGRR